MEIQIAVAKTNKYAVSESGDTLEVVERPNGGLSVVLADGQTSGRGAKAVSMLVVRKVIALLAEGVRDGAAARAASDSLFTEKQGKVISTLNIVSIDLQTNTVVLTRNNPAPFFLATLSCLDRSGAVVNVNTGTVPATKSGNATIEQGIALPASCVAPILFVRGSFTGAPSGPWFAVSGF